MKSRIALKILLVTLICLVSFSSDARRKKRKKKKAKVEQVSVPKKDSIPVRTATVNNNASVVISHDNKDIKPLAQIVVSFVSRGTGIDAKSRNEFLAHITWFNEKNHCELMFDKKPWGREGEIDYCFFGNNEILMPELFKQLKEKFAGRNQVFVNKNSACK